MFTRSLGVALACALLVCLTGCGNNRSGPGPQSTRVPSDQLKWARTYCTEYGLFISAGREAKTTKAAALELTSTATSSLRDMADATEDLGVLVPEAKDTHEHLIKSLRALADGYAAAQDRIDGLPDTGFGSAFAAVLAQEVGSNENDVEDLSEELSSRYEYRRALDEDRVCAGVRYMQGK